MWYSKGDTNGQQQTNNIDGSVQECSIPSALAVEILQTCTNPSIVQDWNISSVLAVDILVLAHRHDQFATIIAEMLPGSFIGACS